MIEPGTEPTVEQVKEKLNETLTWLREFHEWGLGEREAYQSNADDEDNQDDKDNQQGGIILFSGTFPPPPPPPNLL